MKKRCFSLLPVFFFLLFSCKKTGSPAPAPSPGNADFAKGADVSWLTQMESDNYQFYNSAGQQEDCMQILQQLGMNAIRLRAWVNPSDGWCNTADVLAKALRAKNLGMQVMIDFHYSDSWADPGKQYKPAAWAGLDFDSLKSALYNYTVHVMDTLKNNGVVPKWVQVGNETDDGMLWEDGRATTNMASFAALVKAGYDAVKSVSDTTLVIVHISNGYDNAHFRWIFDGLKSYGTEWDIIGMSLYPDGDDWPTYNYQCLSNINDLIGRYGKPVMICEVGLDVTDVSACQSFLSDLISKTRSLPGNMGLGVFYWEPESYNWQGYTKGAFDNTGRPTAALNAFSE